MVSPFRLRQGARLEAYLGHVGHATVEHAARVLPAMIKQALDMHLRSSRGHVSPSAVTGLLSDCIVKFDHSITTDFTRIFPGGPDGLQRMTGAQIRRLFHDRMSGSQNLAAAVRCLQGCTVLVAITDPAKQNLWIANLGDSQAGALASAHTVTSLVDLHLTPTVSKSLAFARTRETGPPPLRRHFTTATTLPKPTGYEASIQENANV